MARFAHYTATQLVWKSAGFPKPRRISEDVGATRCAICGGWDEYCLPLDTACPKSSFSGHQDMKWMESEAVCRACTWSMEGRPPNTLRMWSILYREDCEAAPSNSSAPNCGPWVHLENKGNLDAVGHVLLNPPWKPWCLSIADSGKIHILPYTPTNTGEDRKCWIIRIERENVHGSINEFGKIMHSISVLVGSGFAKKYILSRDPPPGELVKRGINIWKDNIDELPVFGNTSIERIALMIIRKDNADEWRKRTEKYR